MWVKTNRTKSDRASGATPQPVSILAALTSAASSSMNTG